MLSMIMNLVLAISVVVAVGKHATHSPIKILLRYFTVLSNLFCAFAALAVAICRMAGVMPASVLIFKYVGTVELGVTFLTTLLFLGPTLGYKVLYTGPDLWLHLFCPLLAFVSFLAFDKVEMPFACVFLGVLPMFAYGCLYMKKVVFTKDGWSDFYGFNRGGKWLVSFLVMTLCTFALSWCIWLL